MMVDIPWNQTKPNQTKPNHSWLHCLFFQSIAVSILLNGHIIHANKMHRKKVRWELYKNAICCFEQKLEATLHKIAGIQPPTYHLTNHPSKTNKTLCESKDEHISNVLLWTPTHGHTSVGQSEKTYTHHISADTGCSLEDLPGVIDDRDGWWERFRELCAVSATWWWSWWWQCQR